MRGERITNEGVEEIESLEKNHEEVDPKISYLA